MKRRTVITVIAFLSLLTTMCAFKPHTALADSSNLVGNAGFETAVQPWSGGGVPVTTGNWTSVDPGATQVSTLSHGGSQSAMTQAFSNGSGAFFEQDFQSFPFNQSYKLSFWVYPQQGTQSLQFATGWDRGSGAETGNIVVSIAPSGTTFGDWNQVTASGPAMTYGQWHQISIVEDACTQTHQWSIDGQQAASTTTTVPSPQLGTILFGQPDGTSPENDQFYWDDVSLQTVSCPSTSGPSTATVNYGDGSGTQPLTLNPDGTFNLSHTYGIAGIYTVTATVTNGAGSMASGTATVTVNNVAPTITSLSAPLSPTQVNTPVNVSAGFTDPGIGYGDTHTAVWSWGDGTTSIGTVVESGAAGSVSGSHSYTTDGVYTISMTVADDNGASGSLSSTFYVVIYDPNAGFVTGGGWISSPAGALAANPNQTGRADFGFVSKYQKGATVPSGQTQFQFKDGNLDFHSSSYDWLVISGQCKAQYKGSGTVNGTGNYGFMLTAIDGERCGNPGPDNFRIKLWDETTGNTVYDNQAGAADTADPTTTLGGGDIQIHS